MGFTRKYSIVSRRGRTNVQIDQLKVLFVIFIDHSWVVDSNNLDASLLLSVLILQVRTVTKTKKYHQQHSFHVFQ
jgi:hypothetical protein